MQTAMTPLGKSDTDGTISTAVKLANPFLEVSNLHLLPREAPMPAALFVRQEYRNVVFSPALVAEIELLAGAPAPWADPDQSVDDLKALSETEVLFATWGTPRMDAKFLDSMPLLKAIFYAAGSPKNFLTSEVFDRGIIVCTAAAANAIPVAEFTVSSILLSLKGVWTTMRETRVNRTWIKPEKQAAGGYHSRVGLVSLGMIGRRVAQSLASSDLEILAFDPHVSPAEGLAQGIKFASLEEIFESCDVISLHTPLLSSTVGMIDGSLLSRMKPHATLINTSRGGIIRQGELCQLLRERPDLTAVLDVCEPEPPDSDSPLWTLPNVVLTPHISGSIGPECRRMGRFMVDEFQRMVRGESLQHQIAPQSLALMA